MRFLNPFFLWFLPLALLPLLLNFIFPVKPFKLPFSSVFLLRAARDSRLKTVTAAKTLILLLRCLAILGLVGAFSKPVADRRLPGPLSGFTAGADRPLSLVVLADRSLSMNAAFAGRSRRDFAAGAGAGILAALGPRDEAALVFFDSEAAGGEWTPDLAAVSRRLISGGPGFSGTDYRKALEKAYSLLAGRSPARKKAALLLSDGAHNGFASMPGSIRELTGYDPAVTLAGMRFPPVLNAWAGGVNVFEEAGRVRLSVAAGGAGGAAGTGLPVNLYAPKFAGTAKTAGRPSGGAAAVFDLPPVDDPSGRAELGAPDALPQDNAVFFSLARKTLAARKVLVLYENPEALKPGGGAYFIKRFFETEAGAGAFSADFMEISGLERGPGPEYGAVIVFDGRTSARQAALLDEFVKGGGGAFIVSGVSGPSGPERAALGALGFRAAENIERDLFMAAPESSSGFESADFAGFDLRRAGVSRAVSFDAPSQNFAVAWYFKDPSGASYPALYSGRRGRGRVLVWTASLSLPYSDLAAKPVFAPFLSVCLRQLNGVQPPRLKRAVLGGTYEGTLENRENVKVAVTSPAGGKTYVLARDGTFKYALTDRPGIYSWTAAAEAGTFAVNPDPENGESSLEPELFPPWLTLSGDAPVEAFKGAVYGVEIGQFLLLLALLFFLGEFFLSRRLL